MPPGFLNRIYAWAIPDDVRSEGTDTVRRAKFIILYSLGLAPSGLVFGAIFYFGIGTLKGAVLSLGTGMLLCLTPGLLRATRSIPVAGNYLTCTLFAMNVAAALLLGDRSAAAIIWLPTMTLMAAVLVGRRSFYFWGAVTVTTVSALVTLKYFGKLLSPRVSVEAEALLFGASTVALTLVIGTFAIVYELLKDDALRQLRATHAQLIESQKMAALGEMSGGVAHEINTPLAIIRTLADNARDSLERGNANEGKLLTMMNNIEATTIRIAKIVAGLKNFSRNAGDDPTAEASLAEIVRDTLALCQEKFRESQVSIEIGALPDVRVRCRAVQISQALLNLMSNSFDALSQVKDRKWIKVEIQEFRDFARIVVSDAGKGIPPQTRERIFQPFFTTKGVGKGTGLGLSISKGLIEAHQGSLQLDASAVHTTFVIVLPRVKDPKSNVA